MADGLGVDIGEVYDELGAIVSIVNRTPVVTGQRVLYDINSQATKPFIREYHLDSSLPYDTLITPNDVIHIIETDKYYMIMNKTPELFENSIVEWNVVLYLCNLPITSHILRPIEVRDPDTYKIVHGWQVLYDDPIYGLASDRFFGAEIDQETPKVGQFQMWKIDLYLPKFYAIKPLDRVFMSETEYYKVETIESHHYPGVNMALLVEDTRPAAPIVDGDIYDG
jgi:hypothetical protein